MFDFKVKREEVSKENLRDNSKGLALRKVGGFL